MPAYSDISDNRQWGSDLFGSAYTIGYTNLESFRLSYPSLFAGLADAGVTNISNGNETKFLLYASLWENVTNVQFERDYISPKLTILQADILPTNVFGTTVTAAPSGTEITSGRIIITNTPLSLAQENWIYVHEIGHALGLQHPLGIEDGTTNGYNQSFTAMSYNGFQGLYASTPMYFDIQAVQAKYGVNHDYNSGDNVYNNFTNADGSAKLFTIWDGGGYDTISTAATTSNNIIDLRDDNAVENGVLSHGSKVGSSYFWIGPEANIEEAIGGSGNDTIYGNELVNRINGGGGDDTLDGGIGDDILDGGTGTDSYIFSGAYGRDVLTDAHAIIPMVRRSNFC